jgi:hypothetical protein
LITKDEENFASLLVLLAQHVMILDCQILLASICVLFGGNELPFCFGILGLALVIFIIPVSQRENVPVHLDHI